jgi:hypothetical protein
MPADNASVQRGGRHWAARKLSSSGATKDASAAVSTTMKQVLFAATVLAHGEHLCVDVLVVDWDWHLCSAFAVPGAGKTRCACR